VGVFVWYSEKLFRGFLKFTEGRDKTFQATIGQVVKEYSDRSKSSEELLRALASEVRAAREAWRCHYNGTTSSPSPSLGRKVEGVERS